MGNSLFLNRFCRTMALVGLLMTGTVAVAEDQQDPWEGFNRTMFTFNDGLDRYLIKPAAKGYDAVLPDVVESKISNVFSNLLEIRNILNDLLQGKFAQAGNDTGRFLVNTTVGLVGLFDVAKNIGLEKSDGEDFGQTLNHWGVAEGPYVVLPFFGPATVSSSLALPIDSMANPVGYIDHVPTRNTTYGVGLLDLRAGLLDAEDLINGDKYTFIRDAFLQRRHYLINDGVVEDNFSAEDEDF